MADISDRWWALSEEEQDAVNATRRERGEKPIPTHSSRMVGEGNVLSFTYKPTPPSGPPPSVVTEKTPEERLEELRFFVIEGDDNFRSHLGRWMQEVEAQIEAPPEVSPSELELRETVTALTEALDDFVLTADWYRRCLEDIVDGRPVRNLDEARSGYDRAHDAALARLREPEGGE